MCTLKPGDLVLCVATVVTREGQTMFRAGHYGTVATVVEGMNNTGRPSLGITLRGHVLPFGYVGMVASAFIRIDPENLVENEDEELVHA